MARTTIEDTHQQPLNFQFPYPIRPLDLTSISLFLNSFTSFLHIRLPAILAQSFFSFLLVFAKFKKKHAISGHTRHCKLRSRIRSVTSNQQRTFSRNILSRTRARLIAKTMPGRKKVMTSINVHICDKGKSEDGIKRDNEKPLQYQRRMSSITTTTPTPTVKLNNNVPTSSCSNATDVLVNTDEKDSSSSEACYERCHYCDDLILPPIYQCFNGHIFCATCEPKILTRRCPECDAPLSDDMKIRNRYMEKQIEQVAFGCAPTCQVKLSWENVKEHWTYCSHRKHPICQHLDLPCAVESTSEQIIDHFNSAHNISGVQVKASYNQLAFVIPILQKVEKTHFRLKKICWTPHYFQFDNNIFFMRTLWDAGANSVTWVISQLILRNENEGQKNQNQSQNQGYEKNVSPYLARIKVTRPGSNATAEYTETQLEIQSLINPSSTYGSRQNQHNKSFGFEMNMNKLEEKFCSQVTVQNGWRNNKTGRAYYKQELQWIVQVEIFLRSRRAHFRSFAYKPMLTTGYRITDRDREPRGYNIDQFLSSFSGTE